MCGIVQLRHRESIWSKDNRLTMWVEVLLSDKAAAEADRSKAQ